GADLLYVHLAQEARPLHAQRVVADAEEEALGVPHRPHRPVEDVDAAVGDEWAESRQGRLRLFSGLLYVAAIRRKSPRNPLFPHNLATPENNRQGAAYS